MGFLKKYSRIPGNSILESVLALCVISACLYIAVLIYANVFNGRTSSSFYISLNKINELYFLSQVRADSLGTISDPTFEVEEEWQNPHLKKISIMLKDSITPVSEEFFIQAYD